MRLISIGVAVAAALALSTAGATETASPAAARTGAAPPSSATSPSPSPHQVPASTSLRHRATVVDHYVDLNSASRKELMTLPGIGKTEADRIVANRPYLVKTDLVSKNVLPIGPYQSIRHLVVAMPKSLPQGKH